GDAALHVDRTAAVKKAVLYFARKGAVLPGRLVADRHHVGMSRKSDVRRLVADPCIEIVDIGKAGFGEGDAMHLEAGGLEQSLEHAERAGIGGRYGRTADEGLRNREGIIHAPRLTCIDGGGLPIRGINSISLVGS